MLELHALGDSLSVLCLGAHPDDIEIGCGGTLLELARRPGVRVHGVVLTGAGERKAEAERALPAFFPGATVEVEGLPDGQLPAHWASVKGALERVAEERRQLGAAPDVILAPRVDDAHQDHRLIGQVVSTVWRDALVFHYEVPKWDADLVPPSHYVTLDRETGLGKVELLNKSFPSQLHRDWWDDELFLGLMRVRGIEARSTYAEGFSASKILVRFSPRRPHRSGVAR